MVSTIIVYISRKRIIIYKQDNLDAYYDREQNETIV